jgi:site-specific DNA recombinase
MKNENKKSVVLARVSSRAQELEGYSLDSQEKLLIDYNERSGFKVVKIFKIAESASKVDQRHVFHEMMKFTRDKKINIITVEKVDRFVRNFKDVVLTDEWLEGDENRQVHFVKDGIVLHKNARSQEKLNWGIRVVIAKNYIDNLKEEVLKGQQEKLAQGWFPSKNPVGYKTIGESGKRIHVIDEQTAPLVKKVFEKYMETGENLTTVTAYSKTIGLTSRFGRPMVRSHVADKVLRNKFYIGINTWVGVDYPGAQETFIDRALFEAVQNKMTRKNATLYRKHNPDLKGIMHCSNCHGRITWEIQKGHWYGHCNTRFNDCETTHWVRQEEVERQLMTYFDALTCPDPKIVEWVITYLKDRLAKGKFSNIENVKQMQAEQDRLRRQLVLMYDDRLAERISTDQYDQKHRETNTDIETIEKKIQNVDTASDNLMAERIEVLEKTQIARDRYHKMTSNEKKQLLLDIFTNRYLNGKTLEVTFSETAEFIADKVEKHKNDDIYFRTLPKTDKKKNDNFFEQHYRSIWLGMGPPLGTPSS